MEDFHAAENGLKTMQKTLETTGRRKYSFYVEIDEFLRVGQEIFIVLLAL